MPELLISSPNLKKYGEIGEKRMNYLKRKLLQWNNNAKLISKEAARIRLARWSIERCRIANARKNWKDLTDKYDMFINKTALYQLKTRLRNWLKLRDMAEKLRGRFTKVGSKDISFNENIIRKLGRKK